MAQKKKINPFYLLLVIAGAAFAITAMAYGVMTVRSLQASRSAGYGPGINDGADSSSLGEPTRFDELVDQYGTTIMVTELVLLAIGTVGAIGYDQYLDRQATAQNHSSESSNADTNAHSRKVL